MSHLRRFALGSAMIMSILVLGLVIDAVVYEIIDLNYQFGVDQGPFAAVLEHMEGVVVLVVPLMLLGVVLWLVWASIREERQEERRRRVR